MRSSRGDDIDPNEWTTYSDGNIEEEEDWQEVLKRRKDGSAWSTFESADDTDATTKASLDTDGEDVDDGADAWLDILQGINAEEVNFMQKENERADKVLQMQQMGFTSEQVKSTLGVEVDESLEVLSDEETLKKFQDVSSSEGFGMIAYDDEDLKDVESHTRVDIDEETGEPIRSQMVYVDEHTCIGCTNCAMIAQSTFFMDSEHGRARVFQQWGDDDETIQVAIETCPVDCIHYVPYDELVRLEVERRDQNINFKARLVNQGEYGGGVQHLVGGSSTYTAPQRISGNMGSRCRNCPSAGCKNCPMYGVGKNPEFERKEKLRKEKRARKLLEEDMKKNKQSADL